MRLPRALRALAVALALAGCGTQGTTPSSHGAHRARAASAPLVRWPAWIHVRHPLDLAGPARGGALVLWAAGRLWSLSPDGRMRLLSGSYDRPGNAEPYIALPAAGHRGCGFGRRSVYVLRLYGTRGVTRVVAGGPATPFARIGAPGLLDGIAFDETGRFGHRLLVTVDNGSRTTVEAIDCRGQVVAVTRSAPRIEGGIVVAGAGLGPFTGDLIAPDEHTGLIWAISPDGRARLVARSGLPAGQDVGVESELQVPRSRSGFVLASDRLTPRNRHPGDNVLLRVSLRALYSAGVRAGDLLVGTEGAARLDDVRCSAGACTAREVAAGPSEAHLEGHLAWQP